MKKIIFVLSFASLGGIEKSLLNLLHNFDFSKYSVDIALLNEKGGFHKYIPKEINIIPINCFKGECWNFINDTPYDNLTRLIKRCRIITAFIYAFLYLLNKYTYNKYQILFYKWITRYSEKLSFNYDIAIAYGGPNNLIDFFVYHKISALKKIGWIHFDISKFGCSPISKSTYKYFDKICIVSKEAKDNFLRLLPQYKKKTIVFYNKIQVQDIIKQANERIVFKNDKSIKILTVGGIREEKGQIVAIKSLKVLIDKGYNIIWYFVGDGPLRNKCENLAKELGISKQTIFEGNQINPYVYMKNCDIYVQPSLHEGYCITLAEALCFPNPIVSTNFAGAREQLQNRENATITKAQPELLANAIIKAMDMPQIQNSQLNKYNNNLDDLYKLLDE